MAADVPHLGLEAATKLLGQIPCAKAIFRRRIPSVLETDGHHGTDDGTADGPRAADTATKAAGDPGERLVLYPYLLAHGQQDRLRSIIAPRQQFLGRIQLHGSLPLPSLASPHHRQDASDALSVFRPIIPSPLDAE